MCGGGKNSWHGGRNTTLQRVFISQNVVSRWKKSLVALWSRDYLTVNTNYSTTHPKHQQREFILVRITKIWPFYLKIQRSLTLTDQTRYKRDVRRLCRALWIKCVFITAPFVTFFFPEAEERVGKKKVCVCGCLKCAASLGVCSGVRRVVKRLERTCSVFSSPRRDAVWWKVMCCASFLLVRSKRRSEKGRPCSTVNPCMCTFT